MPPVPGASPWRLLGLERGEPAALLAHGLELLDAMAGTPAPALRWYVSTTPALVLGRGQRWDQARADLPVVTRYSGGGAVLMDTDLLSLDVLLPAGHHWLGADLGAAFLHVGAAWAQALADLGVTGLSVHTITSRARRLGDTRDRLLADICFALPGKGEVLHQGRKVVGLAQRRRRQGALVQCGLLRRWRPGPLLAALGAEPADPQVRAAAIGLDELLDPAPDDDTVMRAVERRIADASGG